MSSKPLKQWKLCMLSKKKIVPFTILLRQLISIIMDWIFLVPILSPLLSEFDFVRINNQQESVIWKLYNYLQFFGFVFYSDHIWLAFQITKLRVKSNYCHFCLNRNYAEVFKLVTIITHTSIPSAPANKWSKLWKIIFSLLSWGYSSLVWKQYWFHLISLNWYP